MKTTSAIDRLLKQHAVALLRAISSSQPLSVVGKAAPGNMDDLIVPDDATQPLVLLKVQCEYDPAVYRRVVAAMAAVQREYLGRDVHGVVMFCHPDDDPRTEPCTRVVHAIQFPDALAALERRQPGHLLVAAFQPMLERSDAVLQARAAEYYRRIAQSEVPSPQKGALLEVFIASIWQRFPTLGKQELGTMILGDGAQLLNTRVGQKLFALGKAAGEEEARKISEEQGLTKALLVFLAARHGSVPDGIRQRLATLGLAALDELTPLAVRGMTLEQMDAWLTEHAPR